MSIGSTGAIAALAVIAIIVIVAVISYQQDKAKNKHYDEMQQQVRGKGARIALILTVCLLMGASLAYDWGAPEIMTPACAMFLIGVAGGVFSTCYSVWKGVYFRVNETEGDQKNTKIAWIFILFLYVVCVFLGWRDMKVPLDLDDGITLGYLFGIAAVFLTGLAAKIRDKRTGEDE